MPGRRSNVLCSVSSTYVQSGPVNLVAYKSAKRSLPEPSVFHCSPLACTILRVILTHTTPLAYLIPKSNSTQPIVRAGRLFTPELRDRQLAW